MTDKEIYDIVHEENLGYDVSKTQPRNSDPSQKMHSVVPRKTDQEIYDLKCTSISMTPSTSTMKVGGVMKFYVTGEPKTANIPELIWESTNPSVAMVDQEGLVTAYKKGSVNITATSPTNNKITASCALSVVEKGVTGVVVEGDSSVVKGKTITLTATVTPTDADNKVVRWVSLSKEIATVNETSGVVTGMAIGKATIKAIATDGSMCEGVKEVEVTPIKVESIALNEDTKTLTKGGKFTPKVTFTPENADDKSLEWTSNHPEFAEVSESGEITAVAVGSAVVTAKTKDGSDKTATCTVTVEPAKVTKITLSESTKTLDKGHTFKLTATIEPENADNKGITWSSEADGTATVTQEGLVTAKAAGTTNIVATAKDGSGVTAKCSVTVNAQKVTEVSLDATKKTVTKGDTFKLTATVTPDNADVKTLQWESSEQGVASVSDGTVTTLTAGSTVITAKSTDGSNKQASCTVTVNPKLVSGITLNESTKTLERGGTFKLTATVTPTDADNKQIQWESSDSEKASVDGEGNVTAVAVGEATITAKSKDGSNKTATCVVTVGPKKVTSVTLTETTKTVTKGDTFKLTANVAPTDADNKTLEWSSNAQDKATVDQQGNVTTKLAGSAVITVKSTDGSNKQASCTVTINPKKVNSITVDPTTKSIKVGEKFTPTANVQPADADNKGVTWSSGDGSKAIVNAETGEVEGKVAGKAVITATAKDGSGKTGTCTVTVSGD